MKKFKTSSPWGNVYDRLLAYRVGFVTIVPPEWTYSRLVILRVLIARHDRHFKVVFRVLVISVFGGFGSDVDQGPTQGLELFSEPKRSVGLTLELLITAI